MHRVCCEQQYSVFKKIMKFVARESDQNKIKLKDYINRPDDFGSTPIILSCVLNNNEESDILRFNLLKDLIAYGANVNKFSKRTFWGPLHWCCFYKDYDSVL